MKRTLIALSSLIASAIVSTAETTEKPNILFIFADDYAYDCLAAHGNTEVKTPHLDKLSSSGTHFSHAYNPGGWGGAVCVASRTMMMQGKQIWAAHRTIDPQLAAEKKMFPQLMQQAGYDTYFSGKWHVKVNCDEVWQNTIHTRPGMPYQAAKRYKRNFTPGEDDWSPYNKKLGGFWSGGKHWSEVLADDGATFLKQAAKKDKPFMMMLCFNAPHDPRQAPKEFQDMYPYKDIAIPKPFKPEYDYDIGSNKIRDEKLAPFPRTKHSIQVNRSEYYALITHMDQQVGKILKALEETGKADNTIIIFSADHGLSVGHHGLIGKQNLYEHSVRVPWIIAGPGIPKGKTLNAPIYLQDAMATCLDLAKLNKPDHVDFNSVLPIIAGENNGLETVYGAYAGFQRMVIHDDYKLLVYPHINKKRLFHLPSDPDEANDLIDNPEHQQRVADLEQRLAKQMTQLEDPLDLKNPKESYKAYPGQLRKGRNKKYLDQSKEAK